MKRVLEGLEPKKVFWFFEEVSRIPRNSGDEQRISDYLVDFAVKRGLKVQRDEALNVVIDKPATPGYEHRPKIMLQGHMDMVCVKDPGVEHDFTKDPIELIVENGLIRANGTSLGADDGNALALCLALLDDDEIEHPAIQAIFTVEEEVNFGGALKIDGSMLDGQYLIGLDYSQNTNILVSCAGSSDTFFRIPTKKQKLGISEGKCAVKIKVSGLASGHSGIKIINGHGNAIRILGEVLSNVQKEIDFRLGQISGGAKKNVIPAGGEAVIVFDAAVSDKVEMLLGMLNNELKKEYRNTDPGLQIDYEFCGIPKTVYEETDQERILTVIDLIPDGLQNYLDAERTLTKCSMNMGSLIEIEDGIEIVSMIRSNSEYEHDQILRRLKRLATVTGVEFIVDGRYPGWEYDPDSMLTQQVQDIWEDVRGQRPPVNIIHAGVETGLLMKRMQEQGKRIEAINLGTRNWDVHTTRERTEIDALRSTYKLLIQILKRIK